MVSEASIFCYCWCAVSSTSRGGKRSSADFYGTPAWAVHRLLESVDLPGGRWLECAAGEGAIIKAVNEKRTDVNWLACEKREKCRNLLMPLAGVMIADYLKVPGFIGEPPAVSISNYPFSLAVEFIERGLKSNIPYVISLLRLNFLGTEDRNAFFRGNMPDIHVIPDRVSFAKSISCFRNKKGCTYARIVPLTARIPKACPKCGFKLRVSSSDSSEYAWYVWGPERGRKEGKIQVLRHTPLEERKD
jgi:hypothetical protein